MSKKRGARRESTPDPFDPLDGHPEHEIDLHTFTVSEAEAALRRFLADSCRRSPGCLVLVITGKGNRSANGAVLRGRVRTWLNSSAFPEVVAAELDDGEGAYLVRVRGGRW